MARRLIFEIVGDDASAINAFRRTGAAATGFERDIGRVTRGAAAGSGVFRALGRSIAFASGGFLAFASGAAFLRKSVDAAETTEKAFRALGAQAKASQASVHQITADIAKLSTRATKLGFNTADLEQGFTILLRGSGSAQKALTEMGAAEDVARAKGLTLAQGALVVNRALVSSGNSARSLGIHFPKAATEAQKLAIILQRFRGQAAANTTETDRFSSALFNTEAVIGAGILPVLNRYLASFAQWLQQMDESGRLQRDVAVAAKDFNTVVKDGAVVLRRARTVISGVDDVTGSFENTLKALAGAWLLVKTRTKAIEWGLIATGEASVGTAATIATGEVTGLAGALGRLKGLGPLAIPIALSFIPQAKPSTNPNAPSQNPVLKTFAHLPFVGPLFSQANRLSDFLNGKLGITPGTDVRGTPVNPFTPNRFGGGDLGLGALKRQQKAADDTVAATVKKRTSLLGQFNLLELKLADAERTNNTVLQRSILVAEESILVRLEDQAKTLKKRTGLAQQAAGVADQIRSIDQANVQDAKRAESKAAADARKAAAARKKAAEERKKAAERAKQFDVPLALQVADARAQALGLPEKSILEKIRAVAQKALKSGRLGLQGQLDAWNEIGQLNDELKQKVQGDLTKFKHVNTAAIVAGLGLTADQLRAERVRLAQVGAGGTVPGKRTPAFAGATGGGGFTINGGLHLHGVQNLRQLEDELEKRRRSRPSLRRGT